VAGRRRLRRRLHSRRGGLRAVVVRVVRGGGGVRGRVAGFGHGGGGGRGVASAARVGAEDLQIGKRRKARGWGCYRW
jgi:hypothetical protein